MDAATKSGLQRCVPRRSSFLVAACAIRIFRRRLLIDDFKR
ncbi:MULTISPECIES: hypothetical protein [Paraburkholderia]|nr:hypothetical protein [Paraburkholderia podalyriae]